MKVAPPFWGRRLAMPALACFLGLAACRFAKQDKAELLLSQLPSDQALQVFLDVERLRSLPELPEIIAAKAATKPATQPAAKSDNGGMVRQISNDLGLDIWSDVDALAASLGTGTLALAVSGSFSHGQIQQHLSDNGATCTTHLGRPECLLEAASTNYIVWLDPAQQTPLTAASGTSTEVIRELRRHLEPNYLTLAAEIQADLGNRHFLWIGIDPRRLGVAMRDPPRDWINLSLLANALQHASRAVATVGPREDGQIEFQLRAFCASAEEAETQSALLKGLFSFAAAALDAGRGKKLAENSWSALLRSADVSAVESQAEARMLLGVERLTQLLDLH